MAYAATITTENLLGGKFLIRVEETDAAAASAKVIELDDPNGDGLQTPIPFEKFRLLQVEAIKVSGDAATITPKLQRHLADGSTLRTMFEADEAVAEMVWTFGSPPLVRTTKLKHAAVVASGTNNVVWTEYTIERAD